MIDFVSAFDLTFVLLVTASDTVGVVQESAKTISWVDFFSLLRVLASALSLIVGAIFIFAGTLGVLRLPDFFTRLHAAGMTDTLGAEMIILGLIIQAGISQSSMKLLLIAFLLLMTSPTATHAVASAAFEAGLKPLLGPYKAPSLEEMEAEVKSELSS